MGIRNKLFYAFVLTHDCIKSRKYELSNTDHNEQIFKTCYIRQEQTSSEQLKCSSNYVSRDRSPASRMMKQTADIVIRDTREHDVNHVSSEFIVSRYPLRLVVPTHGNKSTSAKSKEHFFAS